MKSGRLIGTLSLLLSLVSATAGIARADAFQPKIGVVVKGQSDFWKAVIRGAQAAGQQEGYSIEVVAPKNELESLTTQVGLFDALVAERPAAIIVAPSNGKAMAPHVRDAMAAGIKVVVIDSPLPQGSAPAVFVGTDHQAAGDSAGRMLAKLLDDNDEITLFRHDKNGGATARRDKGAIGAIVDTNSTLAIHTDMYASIEPGKEEEQATALLDRYPGTRGILATGTPGTMAMIKVLEDRGLSGKIQFVGFGFNLNPTVNTAIQNGTLHAWIAQLPRDVGFKGVTTAVDLLQDKPVDDVVHPRFILITRQNLNDPDIQALQKI